MRILIAQGTPPWTHGMLSLPGEDPLTLQLQRITEEHNVDEQLAAMRQQMQISGPTATPKA